MTILWIALGCVGVSVVFCAGWITGVQMTNNFTETHTDGDGL
jgi:hypothetical protein